MALTLCRKSGKYLDSFDVPGFMGVFGFGCAENINFYVGRLATLTMHLPVGLCSS